MDIFKIRGEEWNQITERHLSKVTDRLKQRRIDLFVKKLGLGKYDVILDLGSEDGSTLSKYYPYPKNIVLADIEEESMKRGVKRYGLKGYEVIPKKGPLPFDDHSFDAVWCNSVIEHVIGDWKNANFLCDDFLIHAYNFQSFFAHEIERLSKKYYVQTPNIHFPIESHSWLPFVQYLTQSQRSRLSITLRRFWVKQWSPDFILYGFERFRNDFRLATEFISEKVVGITKSLIAIRS